METNNVLIGTQPAAKQKKFCLASIPMLIFTLFSGAAFFDFLFITMESKYYRTQIISSYSYYGKYIYDYDYRFYGLHDDTSITLAIAGGIAAFLLFAAMVFLTVLLFVKCNKPVICAPFFIAAAAAFVGLAGNVIALIFMRTDAELCHELFSIGIFAFMMLTFILAGVFMIIATKKEGKAIKILSLIPAVFSAVVGILYLVKWIVFLVFDEFIYIIPTIAVPLLVCLPLTIGLVLLGLWISNPYKKEAAVTADYPVAEANPYVGGNPYING